MTPDSILVVAFNGRVFGARAQSGERVWRAEVGGTTVLLRVRDGRAFALGSDLLCLDVQTGHELWRAPTVGIEWSVLVVDDGVVVLGGNGEAVGFAADSGQPLWHEKFKGEGRGLVSLATANDHGQTDQH